ncbi:MAG TPA: hypothetical protein VII78_03270 [Myxococcota bacterium]|jgi:hypothetical protein
MKRLAAAFAAGVLALACGPVPGGELAGEAAPPPAAWSDALGGDRAMCEIEARPANPHSIQLECFTRDGALYVQSHRWALAAWWPESWAEVWLAEPDVRVRIDGRIYALRAVRVTDAVLRETMLKERGYDPVPAGIVLFRFDPRTA